MDKTTPLKNVQRCTDTNDCQELSRTSGLHLKPVARLSITVTLPQLKSGQSISNWEVMERLRAAITPKEFTIIKVTKSTLEFLRFDAEIENKRDLPLVISKIDQKGIKLSGFSELLKIRAVEAKTSFPMRHDWDSFFRDAKHMNEMKPGERPDTVHFQDLPCSWFSHLNDPTPNLPNPYVLGKVMGSFGEVRDVDIPMCDPYRRSMPPSISGLHAPVAFGQGGAFEAYVQFKEYIGFAKCMHALQGKKLVYMDSESKAWSTSIKVDFDRTKHMSEYSIKKRAAERDKLKAAEREREEKQRRKREMEEMRLEAERMRLEEEQRLKEERKEAKRKEKEERRKAREEKRRKKRLMKEEERLKKEEEEEEERLVRKIALEERKLLLAQRKLESIRLLDELFERIKVVKQKEVAQKREEELFKTVDKENSKVISQMKKKELKEHRRQERLANKERMLRDKLVHSYKTREEERMAEQKERVRRAVQGKVRLQSVISAASLSSISSATSEGDLNAAATSSSSSSSSSSSDSDSSSSSSSSTSSGVRLPKAPFGSPRVDQVDPAAAAAGDKGSFETDLRLQGRPEGPYPPYFEGHYPVLFQQPVSQPASIREEYMPVLYRHYRAPRYIKERERKRELLCVA